MSTSDDPPPGGETAITDSEDYSHGSAISRTRRRRFLVSFLVVAVLLVPTSLLFLIAGFELTVSPPDAASGAHYSQENGTIFVWGSRLLLLTDSGELTVNSPGYHPATVNVSKQDERRVIAVELHPKPGVVIINVKSPGPFTLYIDEQLVGTKTGMELELEQGKHTLQITGNSIKQLNSELDIRGLGEVQTFTYELEQREIRISEPTEPDTEIVLPAKLHVTTDPEQAALLIDGQFAGTTPFRITLTPDKKHTANIRKTDYLDATFDIELKPGEERSRHIKLQPEIITVTVETDIPAVLIHNDSRVGATPQTVKAIVGDRLSIEKTGYKTHLITVTADGDNPRTHSISMVTPDEFTFREAELEQVVRGNLRVRKFPASNFRTPDYTYVDGRKITGRNIELTRPFYLGTHEVSWASYLEYDASANVDQEPVNNPVVNVTWMEAAKFCSWLSAQEGLDPVYVFAADGRFTGVNKEATGFRLPTEAEWELAASHNIAGPYPWGRSSSIPQLYGNFGGRELRDQQAVYLTGHIDNHKTVAPIGTYRSNVNGIYDLAGNVSEWVHDFYVDDVNDVSTVTDPMGPKSGIDHVIKGSNYQTTSLQKLHSTYRSFEHFKSSQVGFRVARWIY